MPEHEARKQDAGAESLANRVEEIRQVEKRVMRDLQGCIDSTNELLKRIEESASVRCDGS
jgi:hypothetical protein